MKYQILIFSFLPQLLCGQYYFDFENDTIAATESCLNKQWKQIPAGRWECDSAGAIAGGFSLHHSFDNPEAGEDYLILTHDPLSETDSFSISFRVKHGYPPSAANNWQVAVLADFMTEKDQIKQSDGISCTITNGIILGVNFMGSDDLVKLWTCMDGNCEEIYVSSLNYQQQLGTTVAPEFRLVWYKGGRIEIYFIPDPEKFSVELIGSILMDPLPRGRNLVVRYEYSSAQDRKLWIDDIALLGNFETDQVAPALHKAKVLDDRHVQIFFSEPVHIGSPLSFHLSGSGNSGMNPDSIKVTGGIVVLEFSEIIPNRKELQLRVRNICDTDANCLSDTLVSIFRNEAGWGDIVFNELMVDPSPAVLLPEEEYIEIFNRSDYVIDLEGWKLEVNDHSHVITDEKVEPSSHALITGITLPNEGATMALFNENGVLIHSIRYVLPWEGPDWKKEGGWSMESPDPEMVCNISNLWEYSSDPAGGTPGGLNSSSVFLEDKSPPILLYQGFGHQPGLVCLQYSEPIRFSHTDLKQIAIYPGNINPDSAGSNVPISDQLLLWFSEDIQQRSVFQIQMPAIGDCAGNLSHGQVLHTGRTSQLKSGSILINEVMYDPLEGAPEFIEIYNPGEGYFDLRELALDVLDNGTSLVTPLALSNHSRIVAPGEYLVITRSVPHLMDAYRLDLSGQWIELRSMTRLPNAKGIVVLTDRAGTMVDVASYGDQMHMELMDVTRGVSLERISPDRPGSESSNWHSAASIEGYSTPGRKNSQSLSDQESAEFLSVAPEVFSPDNDGFQDLLEITVSPGSLGWVIHLWITDLTGNRIRFLANNHMAGPVVIYTWDGEQENGRMTPGGIYVLHVRVYHPDTGEKRNRKKAFGLIYR